MFVLKSATRNRMCTGIFCQRHFIQKSLISNQNKSASRENESSLDDSDIFSCLYVSARYATKLHKVVNPSFNSVEHYINKFDEIMNNVKARQMDEKQFICLRENLESWEVLENHYEHTKKEKNYLVQQLHLLQSDSSGNNDKLVTDSMEKLAEITTRYSKLKEDLFEAESAVIPLLLKLPNDLHPRTTFQNEILENPIHPKVKFQNHLELGNLNNCISFSKTNPYGHFLIGKIALLELSILEYFERELQKSHYHSLSMPHLVKSPIVEGCGKSPFNSQETITLSGKDAKRGSSLHLVGGSVLESFAAYFTRMCLYRGDLPLTVYANGRSYNLRTTNGNHKYGLYSSLQSSDIGLFSVCSDYSSSETVFDQTVNLLQSTFKKLLLPVRVVQVSSAELNLNESLRVQFEVWSPSYERYIRCAHVSLHGNYLSKRLSIFVQETQDRKKQPREFVHSVSGCAVSTSPLIAAIIENCHSLKGDFSVPEALQMFFEHL